MRYAKPAALGCLALLCSVAPLTAATPADAVYAPLVMEAGTWDANVTWEFKGDTRIFTVYQLGRAKPNPHPLLKIVFTRRGPAADAQ